MNTEQRIKEVIEELAGLQLQQDKLLEELGDLTEKGPNTRSSGDTLQTGDRITIKNPTPFFGKKLIPGDRVATVTRISPMKKFPTPILGNKTETASRKT